MNFTILKSFWQRVLLCDFSIRDLPLFLRNVIVMIAIGKLFYGSYGVSVILSPLCLFWLVIQKEKKKRIENHELGVQFKDALMSVSTAQKAGYSIENSFAEAGKDMKLLYGKNSPICRELSKIELGIKNNIPIETMIKELGVTSKNKDIEEFAGVFLVAKRSGGNMTEIIERCVNVIGKRIAVENEIDVLIAAKRMEAQIMEVVPFGIIAYVGFTNPGFLNPLYGNPLGISVMTVCLVIYIAAYLMIEKIIAIEV
ncbi:MAG: hypothetical protein E7302_11510 [Butyrivibrio sp.]|nr:hypothetical protein [Butyrivibrio sp.]